MSELESKSDEPMEKKPEGVAKLLASASPGFEQWAVLYAASVMCRIVKDLSCFDPYEANILAHMFYGNFVKDPNNFYLPERRNLENFIKNNCEHSKALHRLFVQKFGGHFAEHYHEWKDMIMEMSKNGELDNYLSIPNEQVEEEIRKEKEEKEKAEKREPLTEEQTLKALHLGKYCIVVPYTSGVCYRDLSRTADTKEELERLLTRDERRFGHTYWCETTCDEYPILQEKR